MNKNQASCYYIEACVSFGWFRLGWLVYPHLGLNEKKNLGHI